MFHHRTLSEVWSRWLGRWFIPSPSAPLVARHGLGVSWGSTVMLVSEMYLHISDWFVWPCGKETYVCNFKKCMSWSGLSETSFCGNLSAGHLACKFCMRHMWALSIRVTAPPRWMKSSIQCKVLIVCSDASARIYDRDGVWAQFWRIFEENCWQPIPMHQLGCLGSSVPLVLGWCSVTYSWYFSELEIRCEVRSADVMCSGFRDFRTQDHPHPSSRPS